MKEARLLIAVEEALAKYDINYKVLECAPEFADTAAFCEHYGISPQQSANTILVASRKVEPTKYAVCVVLATTRLDVNKKVCKLLSVKKASFANSETTARLTGMMIGGVTAIGINDLPIYVDNQVMEEPEIIMGGGNRSSKILLNPKELKKLPSVKVIEMLQIKE
jgi:prolyl-tRNA editing enzyme YbaK/EbsC (Cys-tRNA(Pro) deacylase)